MAYSTILYLLWFINGDALAEERSLKELCLGTGTSTGYFRGFLETLQINAGVVTRNGS
jgi:hypothetical protein